MSHHFRSRLKESLMAVTRSKQFESLRAGISSLLPEKPTKQPSLPEEPEDSPKPETEQEEGAKGEAAAAAAKQIPPKTTSAAAATAATATPVGTATFGSGIVRIWQSLSSQSASQCKQPRPAESTSFTHKRGVTIQPLVVDGGAGATAARRSLFQRRSQRGSPIRQDTEITEM